MKKALRDAWVKALRSGEYEQIRGVLFRGENRCCCLGVLCRVANVANLTDPKMTAIWSREPYEATGFDLVAMNDSEGKTFPEIADWIEKNIPVTP